MKKILLILSVFVAIQANAQKQVIDTLFESSGAIDTTIYRIFKGSARAFILDVNSLADNDSIDIGYSSTTSGLCSFANFPLVLTKATYKKTNNGTTTYWFAVEAQDFTFKYAALRFKSAGACSPAIRYNP